MLRWPGWPVTREWMGQRPYRDTARQSTMSAGFHHIVSAAGRRYLCIVYAVHCRKKTPRWPATTSDWRSAVYARLMYTSSQPLTVMLRRRRRRRSSSRSWSWSFYLTTFLEGAKCWGWGRRRSTTERDFNQSAASTISYRDVLLCLVALYTAATLGTSFSAFPVSLYSFSDTRYFIHRKTAIEQHIIEI